MTGRKIRRHCRAARQWMRIADIWSSVGQRGWRRCMDRGKKRIASAEALLAAARGVADD